MAARDRRAVVLMLGLLSVLPFAACGDDKVTLIQGGSGELGEIQASPGELSFEHIIGRSPCPQLAGEFLVRNTATSQKTVAIRASAGSPLLVPPSAAIPGGGAQNVPVIFDCTQRSPFEATVTVGDGGTTATVRVRGNVHP
jgi:hypothetical protein